MVLNKIRVLALAYTYYLSDPRVIRESEAVAEHAELFEILCLRRPNEKDIEVINKVVIRRLPLERFRGNSRLLYVLHYTRFFIYSLFIISFDYFKKRYDLIHVHNMPEFLVFSAIVPKLFGAKIILDMHDLMPETLLSKNLKKGNIWHLLVNIESISTSFADFVIGVHDLGNQILINRGVPKNKLITVMNVPDPTIFYPRPFIHDDAFTIIYHGIIAERQGIDILIRSLVTLINDGCSVKLLLLGEGDHLPEIRRLISNFELNSVVEIVEPFVPTSDIPKFLQKAHLGVLPYRETELTQLMLPVKLLEYISMNIPVISSRLNAIEYYFDESMVLFVPPEDVNALSNAIRNMYNSEELRSEISTNAAGFLINYNWTIEREKLLSVYEQLCGE